MLHGVPIFRTWHAERLVELAWASQLFGLPANSAGPVLHEATLYIGADGILCPCSSCFFCST